MATFLSFVLRVSRDFLERLDFQDQQGRRELMVSQGPQDVKVMSELPVCREKEEKRDPVGTRRTGTWRLSWETGTDGIRYVDSD
uniref:Uncharacterized protein n=1 Tax=Sphaerodactylus townsendi TaxID=933632 RepID=A0ACB8FE86_9SAUR